MLLSCDLMLWWIVCRLAPSLSRFVQIVLLPRDVGLPCVASWSPIEFTKTEICSFCKCLLTLKSSRKVFPGLRSTISNSMSTNSGSSVNRNWKIADCALPWITASWGICLKIKCCSHTRRTARCDVRCAASGSHRLHSLGLAAPWS